MVETVIGSLVLLLCRVEKCFHSKKDVFKTHHHQFQKRVRVKMKLEKLGEMKALQTSLWGPLYSPAVLTTAQPVSEDSKYLERQC